MSVSTAEPTSLGSSHFPREDGHVVALLQQRQTNIRDAVRGSGGQGV